MPIRSKTFSESYHEDIKLYGTLWSKCWLGIFLAALVALPFCDEPYFVTLVNLSCIATVGALGLNILTGFTGQISLGHAAFLAIGAYTATLLGQAGAPFWLTLPAGGLAAALAGIVIGIPCLRLKGLYLAMATMSIVVVIEYIIITWESVTAGVRGLQMPILRLAGYPLDSDEKLYFFMLALTGLLVVAAKNIMRTRVGRALVAIRDRDIAAEVMGVDLTLYKLTAFAISSFYAGVAGGLYAYVVGYIHHEAFNLFLSVEYLTMIIVGGLGSILGSIFGAIFVVVLPEFIKMAAQGLEQLIPALQGKYNAGWNIATFGLLIILFLIFEPGGLNSIWLRIKTGFKNWPFTY